MSEPGLTISVAAYNEEENLAAAVKSIVRCFGALDIAFEVLVFDDHSSDKTGSVADSLAREDSRVRAFHNERNLNIGGVYKAGLQRARYGHYLLLPGDNETDVEGVSRALVHLKTAPMVLCYTANLEVRPRLRRFLSRLYVRIVNLLFGTSFRYTNGANILPTGLARSAGIRTDGFSYMTEALVKLVRSGADYAEHGIHIRPRDFGSSSALKPANLARVAESLLRLWWEVRVARRGRYSRLGRRVEAPSAAP